MHIRPPNYLTVLYSDVRLANESGSLENEPRVDSLCVEHIRAVFSTDVHLVHV